MAEHRWTNLIGVVTHLKRKTKAKIAWVGVGLLLLGGLVWAGIFKPNLFDEIQPIHSNNVAPKEMESMSVIQDVQYMGGVNNLKREQLEQAEALKNLSIDNDALKKQLQLALSQKNVRPPLRTDDVKRMIQNQIQLASANTPPPPPSEPPKPRLVADFEPPVSILDTVKSGATSIDLPSAPEHVVTIPAGSVASGLAMNGFLAQSNGKGENIVIHLKTAFNGPNDYDVPTESCRVVASCDAKDFIARGKCETSVMTCTLPGAKVRTVPISGWITASDNVNGEFGTVFWNDAELLKRLGQAALPSVLAELLDVTTTTVTVGGAGGVATQGITSPLGDIAGEIGDLLLDRIRTFIYPVVYVDRNQWVNVYLRETAYIEGTTPEDWTGYRRTAISNPYN